MDSNDLFSFLDDAPQKADVSHDADGDVQMKSAPESKSANGTTRKRKVAASSGLKVEDPETSDSNAGPSEPKKPRLEQPPNPVVVDEVEIEAKREVAASAGLTGAVEAGSRLELRHQVSFSSASFLTTNFNNVLQVRHQVAVPPGYPYIPIANHVPPEKPAREYKFTLDPFQQVSVHAIQRNESVLVSAHTSAGKTVVAEYAIAQCLQQKQRVIYTSPIKASK